LGYEFYDDNIGRYGFVRISRSQLQEWAEAVSDEDALSANEKAYALKLLGDYSDSVDGENVVEELSKPESHEDGARRVAIGRLIDCGFIRVLWVRERERTTMYGIVLGREVWKPEDGEAA
jgi:hypothetical protein